jgi:hypothetical protein
MFQLITELLGHLRKLLPLLEIYTARRPVAPVRDPAMEEFQRYAAEVLRENRRDLMELRSVSESVNQRLRVLDEQSASMHRDLGRIAAQQRALLTAAVIAAVGAVGTLVVSILILAKR